MKKAKSMIVLMTFMLTFGCIMSCDDQEEKIKGSDEIAMNSSTSRRVGNVNFDGTEGDPIDLTIAKKWTANYRGTLESPEEISAHYFGYEIIEQILGESDCVGIRIYYALDDVGEKKLILVGVDSNGENLLPIVGGRVTDGGPITGDASLPCPTYCPTNGL